MKKFYPTLVLFSTFCLIFSSITYGQHSHEKNSGESDHHLGLHFSHPMFTESVSPDTKMRLDYQLQHPGPNSETELESEYAFSRIFSLEAGVHYDPIETSIGNTHLLFKFANYPLEEQGVLLGYGLSLDLPTGSGHGHGKSINPDQEPADHHHAENIYQFSPFLNAGIKTGNLELVGWSLFNIPTNHAHPEDATTSLDYNISALYHLSSRIQSLVELTGTRQLSGVSNNGNTLHVAPGLRAKLLKDTPLILGLGMRIPVTKERSFDNQVQVTAFYHF